MTNCAGFKVTGSEEKPERWICGHIRKCKWIGRYEDLQHVPDKKLGDRALKAICPRCGYDEFYVE